MSSKDFGIIYVLQFPNTEWFKIGETKNFEQRYKALCGYLPLKPIIILKLEVSHSKKGELFLKKHFKDKILDRSNQNEWYLLDNKSQKWLFHNDRREWIERNIQIWREEQLLKKHQIFDRYNTPLQKHLVLSKSLIIHSFGILTLIERRILIYLLAYQQANQSFDNNSSVYVTDIASAYNLKGGFYNEIRKGVEKLKDKHILISEFDPLFTDEPIYINGIINFSINPLYTYQLQGTNNTTSMSLLEWMSFKSIHTMRMYELIISSNSKELEWHLEEFIKFMGLQGGYQYFGHLKNRVLDKLVKEINEKTSLKISYTPVKNRGRKFSSIRFTICERTD